MIDCKECIYGFLDSCPVDYSRANAACITIHKSWRGEPKDKVIRALNNMREIKINEIEEWYTNRMKLMEKK